MPNNRLPAFCRAKWQKKKMKRDNTYREHYTAFMNNLLEKGYAEKVSGSDLKVSQGKVWYLPHHGVYHPHKANKIRVVFDASARFEGRCLNDELLQGPDMANSLVGVLTRFRKEQIAFMADIESMFYQVKVPSQQHDLLRFLWWPNNDFDAEPEDYRMTVHLFGAISSPSIANFVLKHVANNAEGIYGSAVSETIRYSFYVDDCLHSVNDVPTATKAINDVTAACAQGGFRLTKFISNSSDVLSTVPKEERSKDVQACNLDYDDLPIERALGVQWAVQTDTFGFTIMLQEKPMTKRGMLSVICSIYDPLGFIAPCILPARMLLQDLCRNTQLNWDDEVPEASKSSWNHWLSQLPQLTGVAIRRCTKPEKFGTVTSKKLHLFADASAKGYGAVVYLRQCDENKQVSCSFLIGKSRLAPMKSVTIPRLELTAATVALRLGQQMKKELSLESSDIIYYTDSTTVLHYIKSEKRRFPVFVANRVQLIRDFSEASQWKYVATDVNPADVASRGLSVHQYLSYDPWLNGPEFLMQSEEHWPAQPTLFPAESSDKEHVKVNIIGIDSSSSAVEQLLNHYSDWHRLRRAIAVYLRVKACLKQRRLQRIGGADNETSQMMYTPFGVEELGQADYAIFQFIQYKHFGRELECLTGSDEDASTRGRVSKDSSIYRLDPWLTANLLRVGGRLRRNNLPEETKHPILLPHKCHITHLIIRHIHSSLGHAGRNHVLAMLREKYWVTHANATVRHVISACVTCRRERQPVNEQKMSDLPAERTTPAPPFTFTGVDYFGPFVIKEGRKELKRYGVLFTCLASRAIHIETANSLETDCFIQALRRFTARRGTVKQLRSDNGTNFVGAERELFRSMDQDRIRNRMLAEDIAWIFNPPAASHMGGVWERLIRSVRKTLSSLLHDHGTRLDDESFRTLLTEVEGIVNSRPLTTVSSDVNDLEALTSSHLLTLKTRVVMPPPGEFEPEDMYSRNAGEESSTWPTCFGHVGNESTFSLYKSDRSGIAQEET